MTALQVLLLEDSPAYGELVQEQLAEFLPEAVVRTAATLADALGLLDRELPEVVLADLSLPDADGLEVVHRLHAASPDPTLVVLTGRAEDELALAAMLAGAQEYLVKGRDDGPRLASVIRNAVARQHAEQEARRYERLAKSLLDALEAPTCAVGEHGTIVAVNASWNAFARERAFEPPPVGTSYLEVCDRVPEGDPDFAAARQASTGLRDVLAGKRDRCTVEYACHGPGMRAWFSARIARADVDGGLGALITHFDVSDLKRTEEALSHQALHDELTDLPNRVLLTDRLVQALADAQRRDRLVAVAFLDLDHFKRVNDSLGHPAGDALLAGVAQRLRGQLRAGDTLGRFAGDEFVVVWRDVAGLAQAQELAARAAEALTPPFDLGCATISVSASVGVATGRAPQTAEELLLSADAAMYEAKARGRGRVQSFSTSLRRDAGERLALEAGLRAAVTQGELVLHYQPVIELATGRPIGAEALLRWQHPERGLLPPASFIPVAESSGLIVPVGRWALEQACRDAAAWEQPLDVAVNLSVRQLIQHDVVDHVRAALLSSGLAPCRLLLEVTESAVMEDAEAAGRAMDALRDLGVRIAIDDFGTGYSSLLYLRRYPINALKVDREFVAGLTSNPDDAAIVGSVVSLARSVGATCIAEGVETPEQYAALQAFGCEQAQGYLWSRPVPNDELPATLLACRAVDRPVPSRAPRPARVDLDQEVVRRIRSLHAEGASLHTIAAALNRVGAPHPAGVRWHAHAVARHLSSASA